MSSPDYKDYVLGTAPQAAVQSGHIDSVRLLLDFGASINHVALSESGSTALHLAVSFGFPDMVSKLLSWGADPSLVDLNGKTAVAVAQERRDRRPKKAPREEICVILEDVLNRWMNDPCPTSDNDLPEPVLHDEAPSVTNLLVSRL